MAAESVIHFLLNDPRAATGLQILIYVCGGILGALVKEITSTSGVLTLPRVIDNRLHLGILSGIFLGVAAALLADGNFLTATLSGYAGPQMLEKGFNAHSARKERKERVESVESDILAEVRAREGR